MLHRTAQLRPNIFRIEVPWSRVLAFDDPFPCQTAVTRVATDHGFWELGRFSVAYRALFGESPSKSLRRPADQRPEFLNRQSSLAGSAYQ